MATNSRRMNAARGRVWARLADGDCYTHWVVGTTAIRDVDAHWPAVGSRLHYTVGRGPLRHEGHTEVLDVEPGRRLELEAHAWPLGTARIELRLDDDRGGTQVVLVEHPARGPVTKLYHPALDLLLKFRNVEALRRLERLSQR
jgi:uncharacterized protein YndB with AHSA1/START domain